PSSLIALPASLHAPSLPSFPTRRSSDLLIAQPLRLWKGKCGLIMKMECSYVTVMLSLRMSFKSTSTSVKMQFRPLLTVTGKIQRSEEHTSELQSRFDLVCRLLYDKQHIP